MAPVFAARSRAEIASASALPVSVASAAGAVALRSAFATNVLAALRRGPLIASRRSAVRTRLIADGVRAPVQPRGLLAKGMQPHRVQGEAAPTGATQDGSASTPGPPRGATRGTDGRPAATR